MEQTPPRPLKAIKFKRHTPPEVSSFQNCTHPTSIPSIKTTSHLEAHHFHVNINLLWTLFHVKYTLLKAVAFTTNQPLWKPLHWKVTPLSERIILLYQTTPVLKPLHIQVCSLLEAILCKSNTSLEAIPKSRPFRFYSNGTNPSGSHLNFAPLHGSYSMTK